MNRTSYRALLVAATFFCVANIAHADVFDDWFSDQIEARLKATAAKKKSAQVETVSMDHGSTTFVDQTSGSDLIHTAFNMLPVNGAGTSQGGSGAISASAYALYALATGQDALKPSIYNRNAGLRKLFFTVGREQKADKGTSAAAQGVLYGVKVLPVNQRDATSIAQGAGSELATLLGRIAQNKADAADRLLDILYNATDKTRFPSKASYLTTLETTALIQAAVAKLKPPVADQVDAIVKEYFERVVAGGEELGKIVGELQRRPQFALDFQTTQRKGSAADGYRLQLIYDKGLSDGLSLTLNGGYEYSSSRSLGGDVRGGRAAIELKYNITRVSATSLRVPLQIAFSGEGTRQEKARKYRGQLRVVVPVATGITVPLSFGYGNDPDVLLKQEKDVFGKFGLTFDFAKIVESLRGM